MDEAREREIVHGLRHGSVDAWRALYDAYAERVWRCVARLLGGSSSDVADVVQETFLAAAQSARTYDVQRGSLWFWLWGITRTMVAIHYRKQKRFDRIKKAGAWLANSNGQLGGWLDGKGESPFDAATSTEIAALVRATLAEMPIDYEWLLTAKYIAEESVENIATHHKMTPGAVRSKLARARELFREAFAKYAHEPTEEKTRITP